MNLPDILGLLVALAAVVFVVCGLYSGSFIPRSLHPIDTENSPRGQAFRRSARRFQALAFGIAMALLLVRGGLVLLDRELPAKLSNPGPMATAKVVSSLLGVLFAMAVVSFLVAAAVTLVCAIVAWRHGNATDGASQRRKCLQTAAKAGGASLASLVVAILALTALRSAS